MSAARAATAPLASFAAMGVFWGAWAALLPEVKASIGAADGPFGLALLAVGAGSLPTMLAAGRLWSRLGHLLLVVALAGFAASALLLLFASSLPVLALGLLAIGAASGALDVAMNADVAELEAEAERPLMFGAHALFSLAVLVASVSTGFAREEGLDRFVVLPIIAAALVAVAFLALATGGRRPVARAAGTRIRGFGPGWILALGALCSVAYLIEDAIQSWSALHLERTLAATPAVGGAGPGVFAGSMFLGRAFGQVVRARASDRALVASGGVGTAVGLSIAAVAATPLVALAGFALAGGSVSLVAPALLARAGRLAGETDRGSAISTLTTVGYLGFLVGPGVFGGVAGATTLPVAFLATGFLALLLACAGLVVMRPRAGPIG